MRSIVRDMRTIPSPVALAALLLLLTVSIAGVTPRMSNAGESPTDAIARIRNGPHAQMPPPQAAHAGGPAGKGMTIENGTGYRLRIHFSGPMSQTVDVPDGQSVGVELAVGSYEVAAEVPDAPIMPFYGTQTYQSNMHYWLKFFVERRYR